ncbi:hypothetical protein K0B03_01780 [Patescibacteria group bacterium]|nr:hypothetical protein [Patescibacteria group bacterium]
MTIILVTVVLTLLCVIITHYFGFATKHEYLFFSKRGSQALFFFFLVIFFMSSYLFWFEQKMSITLAEHIVSYQNASPSVLSSLSLGNKNLKKWTFVSTDSSEDIKEFYLRKKNYEEWVIKSRTEDGILIFEKGTINLEIKISKKKDKSHILYVIEDKEIQPEK